VESAFLITKKSVQFLTASQKKRGELFARPCKSICTQTRQLSPTFNVAVAVRIKPPPVPVTVIVNVPFDAPLGTAKSMDTEAVPLAELIVTEFGTTVHFDPRGPPPQVKLITPIKPVEVMLSE